MSGAGSAIQAIMGVAQVAMGDSKQNEGLEQKRKAQGLIPPMEDPEMRTYLGYLNRKRRGIETGGAYSGVYDKIQRNLANTQSGILQSSGGAAGAAILGMQRGQMGANAAFGGIVQQQQGDLLNWDNKIGTVLGDMAKRRESYMLLRYNQQMAESAAKIKKGEEQMDAGTSDIMGGVGAMMGGALGSKG